MIQEQTKQLTKGADLQLSIDPLPMIFNRAMAYRQLLGYFMTIHALYQ